MAEQLKSKKAELKAAKAANNNAVIFSTKMQLKVVIPSYLAARDAYRRAQQEWDELQAQIKAAKAKP